MKQRNITNLSLASLQACTSAYDICYFDMLQKNRKLHSLLEFRLRTLSKKTLYNIVFHANLYDRGPANTYELLLN